MSEDIDIMIQQEVLSRCGKPLAKISSDLCNDLLERCSEVEDLILTIKDEFEERIEKDKGEK